MSDHKDWFADSADYYRAIPEKLHAQFARHLGPIPRPEITCIVIENAKELARKCANNLDAVPMQAKCIPTEKDKREKKWFPLTRRCPDCPTWDEVRGSGKSPAAVCSERYFTSELTRLRESGLSNAEARAQAAASEIEHSRAHLEKDSLEFWVSHTFGRLRGSSKPFPRGSYSHRDRNTGIDVAFDLDEGSGPVLERALALVRVITDLNAGHALLVNRSYRAKGIHVRILIATPVSSTLRLALGHGIVKLAGGVPGNKPGQTEVFPKQAGAPIGSKGLGNLLGAPQNYRRMFEPDEKTGLPCGGTGILDPASNYSQVIFDPYRAQSHLQSIRPLTAEELTALCERAGVDLEDPLRGVEVAPAQKAAQPARQRLPIGGRTYVYDRSREDELDYQICTNIPVRDLLASECGITDYGRDPTHYYCPLHNEPENSASLWVDLQPHKAPYELWYCYGDCNRGGNSIGFYAALKNISYDVARTQLARRLSLDPRDYKATFWPDTDDQPAGVDEAGEECGTFGADSDRPEDALDRFQAALEQHLDKKTASLKSDPERQGSHKRAVRSAFRELTTVLLQAKPLIEARRIHATTFVWGMSRILLKHGLAPEVIVEALSPLLPFKNWHQTKEDMFTEVGSVADRLARDAGVVTARTLRKKLPCSFIPMLVAALFRFAYDVDHPAGFLETMKVEIGFERHVGETYRFLRNLAAKEKAKLKPEGSDKVDREQERIRRGYNQLMTMTSCGRYENEVVTNSEGRTIAHRGLSCHAKGCPRCFLDFAWREEKLALEEHLKIAKPGKQLHTHMVIGIPFELTFHMRSEIARHCKYAKLCAVGFADGKGVLLIVSHEDYVLSRIETICGRVHSEWKRKTGSHGAPRPTHAQCKNAIPQAVVQMISSVKMLYHLELLRRIESMNEERVLDFLNYTYGRRSLTGSNESPYWPSKDEVRAMIKAANEEELADFMPEELEYIGRYRPTMEILARRDKRPFTLPELIVIDGSDYFRRTKHDRMNEVCDGSAGSIKANQAKLDEIQAEYMALSAGINPAQTGSPCDATGPPCLQERDTKPAIGAPIMAALAPGYVKVDPTHAAATAEDEHHDDWNEYHCEDEVGFYSDCDDRYEPPG